MGVLKRRTVSLNARTPGRVREEVPPWREPGASVAAAVWPADLDGLERKHGKRWLIEDTMDGYQARRWIDNGSTCEPVMPRFKVWHATARGLDAALTALGDLQ